MENTYTIDTDADGSRVIVMHHLDRSGRVQHYRVDTTTLTCARCGWQVPAMIGGRRPVTTCICGGELR